MVFSLEPKSFLAETDIAESLRINSDKSRLRDVWMASDWDRLVAEGNRNRALRHELAEFVVLVLH
jgi:hypothetical protein